MTQTYGFELVREEHVAELNALARIYRHLKTGAELLTISNDDENKAFGITFRTPPSDSTGIAHILEHSVLCGSRKYPVKKPFVELLKSSLKTFLNAFTYPDKTCYPVASTNLKDFYNLVDVYLDAVFFPRITPDILQQEGWHYELEPSGGQIIFKGVVFNEMKGQHSSPDYLLYRASQRSLFPETTYGHSSGGDPRYIPDLTYEQFKRFHETLYHPSNARIFFYGDDPEAERLRILDSYLSEFEAIEPPSQIDLQPPFAEPRRVEVPYPAPQEEAGRKGMVTLNWLVGEERDIQTTLALDILSHILLGNAAAPLRKALIDSGLGEDVTGGGFNDGLRQHTFSVGMKGIDPANAEQVQEVILTTLARLSDGGIEAEAVAASLNTIEFALRENNTGSFPRGLSLMLRALGSWLYERDPLEPLRYELPLAAIKAAVERGDRYFEGLIRTTLLENVHRTLVLLRPDPALATQEAEDERRRLDAARAAMGEAELARVTAEADELRRIQEAPDQPEDLARIPTLTIADLDRQGKTIPSELGSVGGAALLSHDLFTNGIAYLDLAFDLRAVPLELLPFVPLFGRALTEMGTERESFVQLIQRIGRETGGISASTFTDIHLDDGQPVGRLMVHAKATVDRAEAALAILHDILHTVRLDDQERFKQIVVRARAGKESAIVPSGHVFAQRRALARLDPSEWADEQMGGITSLLFLRELERQIDQNWTGVLTSLEAVRRHLINRAGLVVNLTLDAEGQARLMPALAGLVESIPAAEYTPVSWPTAPQGPGEGLTIPARVNYVAKAASLRALGLSTTGAASVVSRFLNTAWLWEKVRVQGGAYGGFCGLDRVAGTFTFSSYRDPNLLGTLDVYDRTGAFLREVALDQVGIERNVIGTIGAVDAYQLPDSKGYTALLRHLSGITDAYRQRTREEILATSEADFRAFAEVVDALRAGAQVAVIGSSEAIAAANREHPGLLEETKVL